MIIKLKNELLSTAAAGLAVFYALYVFPQPDQPPNRGLAPQGDFRPADGPPDFGGPSFGPGGFGPGGPGGFGGPGPGMREEMHLVKEFDKDGNGWLNAEE